MRHWHKVEGRSLHQSGPQQKCGDIWLGWVCPLDQAPLHGSQDAGVAPGGPALGPIHLGSFSILSQEGGKVGERREDRQERR